MSQNPLLADPQALKLESLISEDTQVVLVVKTIQSVVPCPKCHQLSSRVHSRYQRTVADLPCLGVTVQIQLLTRRFFCGNQTCVRRIFCERLPRVVAAYGRQTPRLNDAWRSIGMMLGGQQECFTSAQAGDAHQSRHLTATDSAKSATCERDPSYPWG